MPTISPVYATLFDSEVKQAYQGESEPSLRGAVRVKTGVVGSSMKFNKLGKGVASIRIPGTDVTPMNLVYAPVTATLVDWNASEYSDIFSQAKVNFNDRQELAMAIRSAMNRRYDQTIIDAMIAASAPETVSEDIGATDSGMNIAKLVAAKKALDSNNVPAGDRHILMHANQLADLLGTTQITSSDYNSVKALVRGEIDTYMGFQFHTIGDRDEGGLAVVSNERPVFAWHKSAVGLAIGIDIRTTIDWIAEKRSWLVSADFSAGAVTIDEEGLVEISAYEA
jgi:hypothetical protein